MEASHITSCSRRRSVSNIGGECRVVKVNVRFYRASDIGTIDDWGHVVCHWKLTRPAE